MDNEIYVVEFANYDGYNQRFSKVGSWSEVEVWARDGSINKGDVVFKLGECKQPEIIDQY